MFSDGEKRGVKVKLRIIHSNNRLHLEIECDFIAVRICYRT